MSEPHVSHELEGGGAAHVPFTYTLTLEDATLYEVDSRIGQLDILSDPSFELQFTGGARPLHAGLAINYLHLTLPRMGPFLVELAADGVARHTAEHSWEFDESVGVDIRLARMRQVNFTVTGGVAIELPGDGGGAHVVPSVGFSVGVNFDLVPGQARRPRNP